MSIAETDRCACRIPAVGVLASRQRATGGAWLFDMIASLALASLVVLRRQSERPYGGLGSRRVEGEAAQPGAHSA